MTRWWRLVLCGCAVILALTAGPAAWAVFTDPASVTSGTMSAGAIMTPTAPGAAQMTSGATLTYTATGAGPSDGRAERYEVLRYTAATGGTGSLACPATTTPAPCTTTNPPSGTVWFSVRARVGDNWVKESARTAYTPDLAGPALVISAPVNTACTSVVACGTATDASTITSVEYQLQRTRTTAIFTSTTCWNGSTWVATPCTFQSATGTTAWRVPGATTTAYAAPGFLTSQSFTLQVRATDQYGNVSAVQSATYTA